MKLFLFTVALLENEISKQEETYALPIVLVFKNNTLKPWYNSIFQISLYSYAFIFGFYTNEIILNIQGPAELRPD